MKSNICVANWFRFRLISGIPYFPLFQYFLIEIRHKGLHNSWFESFERQPHKMVKHTHANCLSVSDHFVGLALKGLNGSSYEKLSKRKKTSSIRLCIYFWDDPFSKCAKLLEKLNFPRILTRTCVYQGVRNFSFSGNSAYVLHGWNHKKIYVIF